MDAYLQLAVYHRVATGYLQRLVLLGMKRGLLERSEGRMIAMKLSTTGKQLHSPGATTFSQIVDFDLSETNIHAARVGSLDENFDWMLRADSESDDTMFAQGHSKEQTLAGAK